MNKRLIYLMGLITLIIFPIPTLIFLPWIEDVSVWSIFELENFTTFSVISGLSLGVIYAYFALVVMQSSVFDSLPNRVEKVVKNMNLNLFDCVFLSLCAGVGEELLFRSGIQYYLGPIITSVIFVAIHGYLHPLNWRKSLYGLIVLPFILIISYGFVVFGLWFAIAAHFAYDLILFLAISNEKD